MKPIRLIAMPDLVAGQMQCSIVSRAPGERRGTRQSRLAQAGLSAGAEVGGEAAREKRERPEAMTF